MVINSWKDWTPLMFGPPSTHPQLLHEYGERELEFGMKAVEHFIIAAYYSLYAEKTPQQRGEAGRMYKTGSVCVCVGETDG